MVRQCYLCKVLDYKEEGQHLSFHSFPTDPVQKNIWASLLGFEAGNQFPKQAIICSNHFQQSDIEYGFSGKRYLKKGAVPLARHSLFESSENVRMERTELVSFVEELEIKKDQCTSAVKHEEHHLPQIKSDPDSDEEVVETKCIPPPAVRIKREFASSDNEVVETKCIPPPIVRIKKEVASSDDEVGETKCILPPIVRIKKEAASSDDDEVVETKCIPPSNVRIKKEFTSSDDDKDALKIERLVENEIVNVSLDSSSSTASAPETRTIEDYLSLCRSEQTTNAEYSEGFDGPIHSQKDPLKIERLVENEIDNVSLDSSSSTISAPETRMIEDYLPECMTEQTTDGEYSECFDGPIHRERGIKRLRTLSSRSNAIYNLDNMLPTYSYESIGTVLQHDHCYFKLPKEQVQQRMMPKSLGPTQGSSEPDDDTCSDCSNHGFENSEPKKKHRISYIGDFKEEDLADPQKVKKFEESSNRTIIRQKEKIKQLENEVKELNTEYNTLRLKLKKFLKDYHVPKKVLQASIQECGMKNCIDFTKPMRTRKTRKKD